MKILGIKIDNISKKQALEKVEEFLNSNSPHKIFTPNPEMLVDASNDKYFKEVLNSGDLNICDGRGIQLVSKEKITRIPGTDFMLDICKLAEKKNKSVYFLGSGDKKVIDNLKNKVTSKFPNLKIAGSHPGLKIGTVKPSYAKASEGGQFNNRKALDLDKHENNELISDIVLDQPDILFVALGHGKQEKWIDEYVRDLPSIKIAMGVGGAFDYIAGKSKRAPKWLRKIGFEWLYRVIREPKRIKRIWKATMIFLWLNWKNK